MTRLTLTQAAKALGVAQHKLIHLCQKRAVVPDIDDARGRGSSRGFSYRNLFEFAVALEMRRLELPLSIISAVLFVLRSFEAAAGATLPGFALPESLQTANAPTVRAFILDGERLFFSVGKGRGTTSFFGGVDLPKRSRRLRATRPPDVRKLSTAAATKLMASAKTRAEIDLTRIAVDLPRPEV
jgi:hypothetical protein